MKQKQKNRWKRENKKEKKRHRERSRGMQRKKNRASPVRHIKKRYGQKEKERKNLSGTN